MIDLLKFDFCEMQIYDNYLVVVMNEGVTVTPDHNQVLLNVSDTYFNNRNFVYITNRIHSYSVNPSIYFETSKIKNLLGFAVVSKDYKAKTNAEVEKLFFEKPFEIFSTLEIAVDWANSLLIKKNSDINNFQ